MIKEKINLLKHPVNHRRITLGCAKAEKSWNIGFSARKTEDSFTKNVGTMGNSISTCFENLSEQCDVLSVMKLELLKMKADLPEIMPRLKLFQKRED